MTTHTAAHGRVPAGGALFPRAAFFLLLLGVAVPSPWVSPAMALGLGVAFATLAPHPQAASARTASRVLLQVSVAALGFAMNLGEVLRAGRSGLVYTLASIAFALAAGTLLGRWLRVAPRTAYLISVGTAICGGSAIAAVGPAVEASDDEMSVSLGTVFVLNAAGLVLFPILGRALGLTEPQFGLWAALAIHDTSSVVGAGAKYGPVALTVATTVKLARALWIVPLTLATASVRARRASDTRGPSRRKKVPWPWFILAFLAAALLKTTVPALAPVYALASKAGHVGLSVTLFLIGTGMTRASLRRVGARPLVHGIALWVAVAVGSLAIVR